jgi:cephalosporin-C deacetylase-like acetyl esterase
MEPVVKKYMKERIPRNVKAISEPTTQFATYNTNAKEKSATTKPKENQQSAKIKSKSSQNQGATVEGEDHEKLQKHW